MTIHCILIQLANEVIDIIYCLCFVLIILNIKSVIWILHSVRKLSLPPVTIKIETLSQQTNQEIFKQAESWPRTPRVDAHLTQRSIRNFCAAPRRDVNKTMCMNHLAAPREIKYYHFCAHNGKVNVLMELGRQTAPSPQFRILSVSMLHFTSCSNTSFTPRYFQCFNVVVGGKLSRTSCVEG